jgi:lipopolysaccharide exporter
LSNTASIVSSDRQDPAVVSAQFLRSTGWIALARSGAAAGVVARYIVFARLLRPLDFGVIAAANFFGVLFHTLTDPSFDSALVPRSDEVEPYLDTVWVAGLIQGCLLVLVQVLFARQLASVFRIAEHQAVFRLGAAMDLLICLRSPASSGRIARNLQFHISLVLTLAEQIAGLIAGIAAIIWLRDWRGLLAAMYAGHLARCALTYWYFPYRPRLKFDPRLARNMFAYGRWITIRKLADFASRNLDNLTIGHLLGGSALGEYQMAFRLGEMPATEVAASLGAVVFPMVGKLKAQPAVRWRLLVLNSLGIGLVGIIYIVFIMRWGTQLICLTVGARWLGAMAPLRLLCWYGLFRGLANLVISALDGLGFPNLSFRLNLAIVLLLAGSVYPLTSFYGSTGTAAADALSVAVALPIMIRFLLRSEATAASA